MIGRWKWFIGAIPAMAVALSAHAQSDPGLALARELSEAGNHAGAAIEYRRLAMDTGEAARQGALYWMASYEYLQASRYAQAARMLGFIEDATPDLETEVYLLHSENERLRDRPREAAYYLESLVAPERPEPVRRLAARRLAAVRLELKDFDGAREALQAGGPAQAEEALAAITAYEQGKDKNPVVGGLLGLIPGLGYAYSGEYGSAARSLILNALCLWGMLEFADEDQWGGVAVVGFAEITFYSGSIYGGADAAVRYNEARLRRSAQAIEGNADVRPDLSALPVLTLRYSF